MPQALILGFERLWCDLRFATRRLLTAPTFTVFSIVTFALGIGVVTAMYSVTYSAALKPTGVRAQDDVMCVRQINRFAFDFSGPEFEIVRASTAAGFHDLSAVAEFSTGLTVDGRPELIRGE